jgi:hypothetical protein
VRAQTDPVRRLLFLLLRIPVDMFGVRVAASAVAGVGGARGITLNATHSLKGHAMGAAAARHLARPALSSLSASVRLYSASPFVGESDGAALSDTGIPTVQAAAAPPGSSQTRTYFVQRRGAPGWAMLVTTAADVGDLLEDCASKLQLDIPLDAITLQLASADGTLFTAKDGARKGQPVTLNRMDTVDEALRKAAKRAGREIKPEDKLCIILDAKGECEGSSQCRHFGRRRV